VDIFFTVQHKNSQNSQSFNISTCTIQRQTTLLNPNISVKKSLAPNNSHSSNHILATNPHGSIQLIKQLLAKCCSDNKNNFTLSFGRLMYCMDSWNFELVKLATKPSN